MEYSQIFGAPRNSTTLQAPSQPASPASNTAPGTQDVPMADHAITISWLGILIALVLWRIVYEMSE